MKLNLSPDEFVDFVILFLLDTMTCKDMQVLKTSSRLKVLTMKLASYGFKSALMLLFFTIDSTLRLRYKQMKDVFEKKTGNQHVLYISQDANYLKKINDKKDLNKIKKAVSHALKLVNSGHTIDQRKLEMIQEKVIKILEHEGEI